VCGRIGGTHVHVHQRCAPGQRVDTRRSSLSDGQRIVNYIQWQNRDLLHSAHQSPEFRKEWNRFDKLTDEIDPHLYEVADIIS
jgi:hypothetical protein